MASQGRIRLLLLVLIACMLASHPLLCALAQGSCGVWRGEPADGAIQLTQVSVSLGEECRGVFVLSAETRMPGLGNQTLELHTSHSSNARVKWIPESEPQESQQIALLVPSLELELHALPTDRYSGAQISIVGEMTAATVTVDAVEHLLGTALALIAGDSCDMPGKQLAHTATTVSPMLDPTVQLVWEGDLVGAREELAHLLPGLLEQSAITLDAEGVPCAVESLTAASGRPSVLQKMETAFLTWLPVRLFSYFQYQKQPAQVTLEYQASPVVTSTPMTATPEPASPAEREVLEVLRRYEEIRVRSHGPSHDITGLEDVLAGSSLESHLSSVKWQRENNAYYLYPLLESRVVEITVVSLTRIDVLVDRLESREFYIDGKLGKENTVYNDHYQVRYQFKLIDGSWYIVDRDVITLPPEQTSTPSPVTRRPGGTFSPAPALAASWTRGELGCPAGPSIALHKEA